MTSIPELPIPGSPGSPLGYETTPRPRKKLSFKEPETFNHLKLRKPLGRPKLMYAQSSIDSTFDENPFEEENDDLDELEVKTIYIHMCSCTSIYVSLVYIAQIFLKII